MDPDALAAEPAETRIVLRCEGRSFGVLVNHRWLRLPCRDRFCRVDGMQTIHTWDLLTGQRGTVYEPKEPSGVLPD